MKKYIVGAFLALCLIIPAAAIAVTPVNLTVTQTGPHTRVFDTAGTPCNNGGCQVSWQVFRVGGPAKGAFVGYGDSITFNSVAGYTYTMVATHSEYCVPGGGSTGRVCPGTAQYSFYG